MLHSSGGEAESLASLPLYSLSARTSRNFTITSLHGLFIMSIQGYASFVARERKSGVGIERY
jgi:hypothetical protein